VIPGRLPKGSSNNNPATPSIFVSSDDEFSVDAAWLSRDSCRVSFPQQPEPADADEDSSRERQIIEAALAEVEGECLARTGHGEAPNTTFDLGAPH